MILDFYIYRNVEIYESRREVMGQINVNLPEELERKLREIAAKKFGLKKGFLSKAVVEAIREWVERNEGQVHEHARSKL